MSRTDLPTASWYRAATLTERAESLCSARESGDHGAVDAARAERRLALWRSQSPFNREKSLFQQRLSSEELTEAELLALLGEPAEAVPGRFPDTPEWVRELQQVFAPADAAAPSPPQEGAPEQVGLGFLALVKPLIERSQERVRQQIAALERPGADLPFDPDTIEAVLFKGLPGQLTSVMGRTMALELNVARLQGQLRGDTPEERYRSFVRRLLIGDAALEILTEYPVLARLLVTCAKDWVATSGEFLRRLCADWPVIQETLTPTQPPGALTQLRTGAGDRHRGGRSVLIARFASGFQVVYKPRSLAVDRHFQELLQWLNQRGNHPHFRSLRVLDRGDYGWVEFVESRGVTSSEEAHRFYRRQGGYLALLYALEATDFHFENVIASGEHPVLIDLEALFHPRLGDYRFRDGQQVAAGGMGSSVLRTGLLPQRVWANAESAGIDVSGLGAVAGQQTPFPVPQWEGAGTDELRYIRQPGQLAGGQNQPTINGEPVDLSSYVDAIVTGFTAIYRVLLERREELTAPQGFLARFARDEVRVILRATRTYSMLLEESYHPDVLRDALDRDRLLDWLWLGVEQQPHLARVIPEERRALHRGDIPRFTTCPGSTDLWATQDRRIADCCDQSGLALAQQRLQQLDESDLAHQVGFIQSSLTDLPSGTRNVSGSP